MALNDAALVVAANAVDGAITHMQAHSADPGSDGVGFEIGSRTAVNGTVDGDGDISWTVNFTGLGASATFWGVSYWSASTAGTHYGNAARGSGDTAANAAGEFTLTVTETSSAS
jgi:hypothetical protein